jgi:FkbM family methyltransferase
LGLGYNHILASINSNYHHLQMIHRFEPFEFLKVHEIEIDSVLDIGAHKGKWTAAFKKHFPNTKTLMIEANADHVPDLEKVGPYMLALLGGHNDEVDYYMCEDKENTHGNGIYRENSNVPFQAKKRRCATLDSLLPGQKFDLIKMDVQGAELDIIKGSPGFIHNAKYLWLELQPHNYNIGAPSAGQVIGYLHQIGFEFITLDEVNIGNGIIMGMDMIFINVRNKELKTGYNINQKVIWKGYPH